MKKIKYLKASRRDQAKPGVIDQTVNPASDKGPNRKPVSGAFGHSNFGRTNPSGQKTGTMKHLTAGKFVNPAGGVGKGKGMAAPTMSGATGNPARTGTAEDVIKAKKFKFLRMKTKR